MLYITLPICKLALACSPKSGLTHVLVLYEYFSERTEKRHANPDKEWLGRFLKGRRAVDFIHVAPYPILQSSSPADFNHMVFIMRNPFRRLVSGYLHKYLNEDSFRAALCGADAPILSFQEFVAKWAVDGFRLSETTYNVYHLHFGPQITTIDLKTLARHSRLEVYSLERLPYGRLEELVGTRLPENVKQYRGGHETHINVPVIITPAMERTIRKKLKTDFQFMRLHSLNVALPPGMSSPPPELPE